MERLILLLLGVVLSIGTAQTTTSTLTVTLHDVAGAPVVGITVLLRTADGAEELARAATDGMGTAAFADVRASDVRIAFSGQLAGGTPVYQAGNDAKGMHLTLQLGPNHMAFVLDPADGMIAPDPLAVSALEPGGPLVTAEAVFPTAPVATPAPIPTITPVVAQAQPQPGRGSERADGAAAGREAGDAPPPSSSNPFILGLGLALLAILSLAAIGLVVVQRRWR